MTKLQLLLTIGIPSLLVMLSWLSNKSRHDRTDKRIDDIIVRFERRFEGIDQRFKLMSRHFEANNEKLDERFKAIDERFREWVSLKSTGVAARLAWADDGWMDGCQQPCQAHSRPRLLHFTHYSCRVHKTLRVTPAMEAGLSSHVWDVTELVSLLEA